MLNYIEGYGRMKSGSKQQFYETSFASLKESIYCRYLASIQKYIPTEEYEKARELKDEIGAMLFATIRGIQRKRNKG